MPTGPTVATLGAEPTPAFDAATVRAQFPVLDQEIGGRPLVYLDSAASAHKPRAVIDAVERLYAHDYSNVHRGVHTLSQRATDAFESARESARRFLGAPRTRDCIFVRGVTEAVNLVAHAFVAPQLSPGDEVLVTAMEHHSNIVPWQLVCQRAGAAVRVAPIDDRGQLDVDALIDRIGPRTKMVSLVHVSNALGTINPVAEICDAARERGVPTFIDGAQAAPHVPIDVQAIGCDFYTISGHKAYGPTGVGVLWGRGERLADMPPWQGGGDMIREVSFDGTTFAEPPHRFEAGTPNIAGAVGLGAALDWLSALDRSGAMRHEAQLLEAASERLAAIDGVRLIGTAEHKAAVASFVMDGVHPHDIGTVLDGEGVAIRVGHHCAQPLMERLDVPATARASFGLYNTLDDVDRLMRGLDRVRELFG
ncbi:MAG: cysteine desulfurase [Acidobacteriota bacterium]